MLQCYLSREVVFEYFRPIIVLGLKKKRDPVGLHPITDRDCRNVPSLCGGKSSSNHEYISTSDKTQFKRDIFTLEVFSCELNHLLV